METFTYRNENNGGQERIKTDGVSFWISSDFGQGFSRWVKVSKKQAENGLDWTGAPKDIKGSVLGLGV